MEEGRNKAAIPKLVEEAVILPLPRMSFHLGLRYNLDVRMLFARVMKQTLHFCARSDTPSLKISGTSLWRGIELSKQVTQRIHTCHSSAASTSSISPARSRFLDLRTQENCQTGPHATPRVFHTARIKIKGRETEMG